MAGQMMLKSKARTWLVTLRFEEMPEDATQVTVEQFVHAIFGSVGDATVKYEIEEIKRGKNSLAGARK